VTQVVECLPSKHRPYPTEVSGEGMEREMAHSSKQNERWHPAIADRWVL
jgi:hypothetical protein